MPAAALLAGIVALVGPAIAAGADPAAGIQAPQAALVPATASAPAAAQRFPADVDAFTFDSFDVEYRLGRDADGHATLTTVETLVARFPEFDQNRGIRRTLPARYQGRTTELEVVSVTDENGELRRFEVESDEGRVSIVSAVPKGRFARGVQTYVITYVQRDVVDSFDDTGAEEFYWNLNGTDWAQPFGIVSARVVLEDGLAEALIPGRLVCYRGYSGASDTCPIAVEGDTVSARAEGILPYQTATIALGFEPGTFTLFDRSYFAAGAAWVQLFALAVAFGAAVRAIVLRRTRYRDARGRPVIVAEYLPPKSLSPMEAALLLRKRSRAVASQLIDFAVRRVLTIIEVDARWSWRNSWRLRLESALGVAGHERALLAALFGAGLGGGGEHTLTNQDTTTGRKILSLLSSVESGLATRGLRSRVRARDAAGLFALALGTAVVVFAAAIVLDDEGRGGGLGFAMLGGPIVAALIVAACLFRHPLTAEGAEARDHLAGLERYIELAEADRMRVLQSPQGSLREPVDVSSRDERLKLTERLLPWAVLFGHEKQWAQELGRFYDEGHQPSWYSGASNFSVAAFSAGVGAVASTMSSSYSGSSSSGGSSGGGSSGGGGGGGGGGGV